MNALARRIARMIELDGPISVGAFMMLALHDREMGFYAARESIGAEGAFITAPEVSQIFGELAGLWCATCWREQGRPAAPLLLDLGPGRGTLSDDMLRALRSTPDFLASIELILIEASEKLESVQRARLANSPVPVRWLHQWSDIATDRPVFVVANEFFDALPIRQFVLTERGWCERMVVSRSGELSFALSPQPIPLTVGSNRGLASNGAVLEICPAAEPFIEDVGRVISTNGGAALIIDYGHEGLGFGDTLQALRRHAPDEVLAAPGEADVSAHVDFSALVHAVQKSGARAHGPVTQASFLRALGIESRGEELARANPNRTAQIGAAVARLTGAGAMGTLFKVLAIMPADAPVPPGFHRC
jgi:NADH dehydrogenase [ubiquinone] 1 alpha subcomplex assembly factor 7